METDQQSAVASYRSLRRGIGLLGLALPIVLTIGYLGLRQSISAYYYTDMRNWFVGSMTTTGFFLICYRYGKLDTILSSIAGVLAVGVALLPTAPPVPHPSSRSTIIGDLHLSFAGVFLLILAYMCAFLFTKTNADPAISPTKEKLRRNLIYRASGIAIVIGVLVAALCEGLTSDSFRASWNPVFWSETVAVVAFGIAWLVKGQTLFADKSA